MGALTRLNGVVIDVETGGLEPARHALLEVALVAVREGEPVMHWSSRVAPAGGLRIDAEAAQVNGWTPAWGGIAESYALYVVQDFLARTQEVLKRKQLLWIGANTAFDRAFLYAAGCRTGHAPLAAFSHRDVDVNKIASVPWLLGEVPGISVDSLRKSLLGIPARTGPHTALEDCYTTLEITRALVTRLTWDAGDGGPV